MYSLDDVRAQYRQLDKLCQVDTSGIELRVSSRAIRQLGQFSYPRIPGAAPLRITFSKLIMEDEQLFHNTIRHEYAHAALYLLRPNECHGHDEMWRALCRQIGCPPERLVKLSNSAQSAKYLVRCKGCGSETYYMRRGKALDALLSGRGRLRCKRCGGEAFDLTVCR